MISGLELNYKDILNPLIKGELMLNVIKTGVNYLFNLNGRLVINYFKLFKLR